MAKTRITIVLTTDKLLRLRKIQSKVIASGKSYSMSQCVEDHLVLRSIKKVEG